MTDRPQWQDLLPLKVGMWIYLSLRNLPQTLQEVKLFYEEQQQRRQQQRQEAQHETGTRERRPKVKKPKAEFPVYEPSSGTQNQNQYQQTSSIEEVEEQLDVWLHDSRSSRKKAADWTEDELSLLSRLMVKFPGGTPGRWEKIAHELGRSVSEVTTKVKQVKEHVIHSSGLVKLSELKGPPLSVRSLPVSDGACEEEQEAEEAVTTRRRNRKSAATDGGEAKVRGRRQKDFDPAAMEEEESEIQDRAEPAAWTQNQQKLLESALQQFPRGTNERWDHIARMVPGKTKEECMIRYKMLAELVQRRKQVKS